MLQTSSPGAASALHLPVLQVQRLFWDQPRSSAALSVHNLCRHGEPAGIVPGRWLGPWAFCQAARAAWARSPEAQALGLELDLVMDPGGAAPVLHRGRFGAAWWAGGAQGEEEEGLGGTELPGTRAVPGSSASATSPREGLILLVPLVLGLGRLSPCYQSLLRDVFAVPQSIGVVGGRPSASLYFVGAQGDTVLYLDPHETQKAWGLHGGCMTLRGFRLLRLVASPASPVLSPFFSLHRRRRTARRTRPPFSPRC